MGRTENQKLKLLYLKELFERQSDEEHLLSMQDILDALAAQGIRAERKSVYDDILCLQQFGMDIVTVKGRNGGYFLASRTFELPVRGAARRVPRYVPCVGRGIRHCKRSGRRAG